MKPAHNKLCYDLLLDKGQELSDLSIQTSGDLTADNCWLDFTNSGLQGGLLLAQLSLGGESTISLVQQPLGTIDWTWLRIAVPNAVDTLSMQMAGTFVTPGDKWRGVASGPFRKAAYKEKLFPSLGVAREESETWVVVLETKRQPDEEVFQFIRSQATGTPPQRVVICYAPVNSLAGATQVAARSVECAMHTWLFHKWPLLQGMSGAGIAPVALLQGTELSEDEMMARTNEGILECGEVSLRVPGLSFAEISDRASMLTFGGNFSDTTFRMLLTSAGHFSKLPELAFAPAKVELWDSTAGSSSYGELRPSRLQEAWQL